MTDNLFSDVHSVLGTEVLDLLAKSDRVRIERTISKGQAPHRDRWNEHKQNAWLLLLRGETKLVFGYGRSERLVPGSYMAIDAGTRYRIDWISPEEETVWLTIYF